MMLVNTLIKTGGNVNLTPPCGLSKSMFSRERVEPCFLGIFPESLIEIPHVVQKIYIFFPSIFFIYLFIYLFVYL